MLGWTEARKVHGLIGAKAYTPSSQLVSSIEGAEGRCGAADPNSAECASGVERVTRSSTRRRGPNAMAMAECEDSIAGGAPYP